MELTSAAVISLEQTGEIFQTVSGGVAQWISNDKEKISGFITSVSNDFSSGRNNITDFFTTIFDTLASSLSRMRGRTQKAINVGIGDLKPFSWIETIPVPQIPHLAKGGLVTAPTLAMVGDNKGAAHDPEVVSPLSKLQGMLGSNDPEIIRLLSKIVTLIENSEDVFRNNIYLDSEKIESKLVKVRRRKQRRYGGAAV